MIGLTLITFLILLVLAAPLLTPHDPAAVNVLRALEGPSLEHPLGTDHLGRDLLSRLLYGSRWSLGSVVLAAALILALGVTLGAVAGFYGGLLDDFLMRVVDVLLAFPGLVLALAVAGTLGPGIENVMLALVGIWWASYARIVRGMVLALRERPFIEAARGLGFSERRIIFRHILPNILPPVVVLATLEMGELILAIAALNFLGLGAQPPTPEWGSMLNSARPFIREAHWTVTFPGLAIVITVLALNLVGDGLRDALDPRSRH